MPKPPPNLAQHTSIDDGTVDVIDARRCLVSIARNLKVVFKRILRLPVLLVFLVLLVLLVLLVPILLPIAAFIPISAALPFQALEHAINIGFIVVLAARRHLVRSSCKLLQRCPSLFGRYVVCRWRRLRPPCAT